ncbi:MAG: hypothetical protein AAFN40_28090, partial [Cyanobacteria bacterium J06560_6]
SRIEMLQMSLFPQSPAVTHSCPQLWKKPVENLVENFSKPLKHRSFNERLMFFVYQSQFVVVG